MTDSEKESPYVKILEQPSSKSLRFRYECEGRSTGALTGTNSTTDRKTFPKIKVVGYIGRAVVVVSCVTVDAPYRPHPHNLVGKDGFCKKGVCTMQIATDDMTCDFQNLGIQCVKKKDIEESLRMRKEIRVDPFQTGFDHAAQQNGNATDLNSLRLCFQVFIEGPETGEFKIPLKPVVSHPIYDKKSVNELTIIKLSDCSSPVMGNKEIILLCDKISKDDVEVRFYEENSEGHVIWESFGNFQPSVDVHKQYAISFRTPQYSDLEISSPVRVFLQLRCPSKGTTSAARPFEFTPLSSGRKRLWNLNSFSKSPLNSHLTNTSVLTDSFLMAQSSDSAICEPPKKIIKPLLEDILAAEGAEESVYKELNEIVQSGLESNNENSEEVDFSLLLNEDGSGGDVEMALFENLGGGDGDGVYSSFMLAMRNPISFEMNGNPDVMLSSASLTTLKEVPPRPPKSLNELELAPPPPLPPRRHRGENATNSSKNKETGFLTKLFGTSPKKEKKKLNGDDMTNGNGGNNVKNQAAQNGSPCLNVKNTTTNGNALNTPVSPTTSLLKSLIEDERNEFILNANSSNENNNGVKNETVDLSELDVENYALLYVDSSAPHATSSEFDENSVYYADHDLINNN